MSQDEKKLIDDLLRAYARLASKDRGALREKVEREKAVREAMLKAGQLTKEEKK